MNRSRIKLSVLNSMHLLSSVAVNVHNETRFRILQDLTIQLHNAKIEKYFRVSALKKTLLCWKFFQFTVKV